MPKAKKSSKRSNAVKAAWAKRKSMTLLSDFALSSLAPTKVDMVNNPPHYTKGQFETLDVIEDVVQFYKGTDAWSVGNVFRYLSRAPHKGNFVEDLQKAKFYMDNLLADYVEV